MYSAENGLHLLRRPRLERGDLLLVQAGVGQHRQVVEGVGDLAVDVGPVGAGLGVLLIALADGHRVAAATLTGVVGDGGRVVGEVRDVDARQRAGVVVLLELRRREPAPVDPLVHCRTGIRLVHPERQHRVDRQPVRRVAHVVALDRRRAVRAAQRGQRPGERRVPAAVLADDLLLRRLPARPGEPRHRTRLLLPPRRAQVVLDHLAAGVLDDRHHVAAVRTLQLLDADVEHQRSAALMTRIGSGLFRGLQRRPLRWRWRSLRRVVLRRRLRWVLLRWALRHAGAPRGGRGGGAGGGANSEASAGTVCAATQFGIPAVHTEESGVSCPLPTYWRS